MMAREPLPSPDLVVYLQASTEVLRHRQQEGLAGPGLDEAALAALGQAYMHFFFHYDSAPLLVVNTNDLDLRAGGRDLDDLVDRVLQTHTGTQYYTPKK
jgi:deoxyguanosine kinase